MEKPRQVATIDVMDLKTLQELEVGEIVEVVVKGKVTSVRGPEENIDTLYSSGKSNGKEVKRKYPGNVRLEVTSIRLAAESEFAGMEDDDE